MTAATTTAPARYPSLDGLRAISIVLVLFGHAVGTQGFPLHQMHARLGEMGVRVFFVISGFLITSLLLSEQQRRGSISLAKFYYRRALRIFPAFYVMVAVIAGLAAYGAIDLKHNDLLAAVTYTTNYHPDRAYNLNHLWSLAVEEQFYLLWPAVLAFAGSRRGVWIAATFALAVPVMREATVRGFLPGEELLGGSFHTVADSIAIGCVLAGVRSQLEGSARYMRLLATPIIALGLVAVVLGSTLTERWPAVDMITLPASNVAIALLIHWALTHHTSMVGRLLNATPVAYVGTLSYSLYLWQQLFLNPHSTATYCRFPLNIGLAIAAGVASYYLVERPLLRLRERWEPRIFSASSK